MKKEDKNNNSKKNFFIYGVSILAGIIIIALKGVTMDGVTYYRQYDIDSGEILIN